MYQRELNLITN